MLLLSLFPGLDLLGAAFDAEGFTVVRGPDVIFGGDIRSFHPPAGRFDGIIGGPPCQMFSTLANLVRARGYEPKFGNLIPEYQRCVEEARPDWFLMEEVAGAPIPQPAGYGVHSFTLDHCHLDGGDGLGLEQERRRVFTYGVRGAPAADLRRWIQLAALLLPVRSRAVTQELVDNSRDYHKGRVGTVVHTPAPGQREKTTDVLARRAMVRAPAVLGSAKDVPVALGGSGKLKPGCTSPKGGHLVRYRLPEAMRLQGCPPAMVEAFGEHHPFRADAALKLIANGVPLALGRALARAILAHQAERREETA